MLKNKLKIAGALGGAGLLLGSVVPVFAEMTSVINASTSVDVSVKTRPVSAEARNEVKTQVKVEVQTERIARGKSHADEEINRRIKALTELKTRVAAMVRVSAAVKATIAAQVDSEISALTSLKAKIDADTEITVLKTDIQSITKSYRIFALIIPEGQIAVMADKIKATADTLSFLGIKLAVRIAAAKTAGKDVTVSEAALADLNVKVADAKVQADAALAITASLTPDNGDEAKFQANKKALMDARVKLRAGEADLKAAHKDAREIVVSLKKEMKVKEKDENEASSTLRVKEKDEASSTVRTEREN